MVARASDGAEAVALAAEHRPQVIVMDVQMPELNGIEATRRIVAGDPDVGILVLTMGEDDGTVLSALRAGARGYLRKGAEQDEIVRAITTVHGGGVVFGASLARADRGGAGAGRRRPERPFPELTERETEVLDLIAAGRNNGQIASELYLSPEDDPEQRDQHPREAAGHGPGRGDHPRPGRRSRQSRAGVISSPRSSCRAGRRRPAWPRPPCPAGC